MTDPTPVAFFNEAAREAATEALYLRLDATKAEGRIVAKTTHEVAEGVLNAALEALPERSKAILALAALSDEELIRRVADAIAEQADYLHSRNTYEDEAIAILRKAIGLALDGEQ